VLIVKLERILTAIVAALTVLGAAAPAAWAQAPIRTAPATPAPTQAQPQEGGGTVVVVMDLQQVFDNHLRYKAEIENLTKDGTRLNEKFRADQKELQKMMEQLKALKPGTPDYKRQEENVAQFESNLRVQTQLERKDLAEREAKLAYSTYLEVLRAVETFSLRHGIGLVMQFRSDKIDENNPQSIRMGLGRSVVYQRNLDITQDIIQMVNAGTPAVKPRLPDQATKPAGTAPVIPRQR
jgi:Skp family chaperone for outer membrane proteins